MRTRLVGVCRAAVFGVTDGRALDNGLKITFSVSGAAQNMKSGHNGKSF
jgi:hypothetical protein